MRDQKKAEEIAAQRVQLLSPLLTEGLDPAKAGQLKTQICEQTGISERTLHRYPAQYKATGFEGLKPKEKDQNRTEEAIPQNLLEQAIMLRREVPKRSVAQIIQILEWEGLAKPGQIKRSTLQEKLAERGYSARHMQIYASSGVAARGTAEIPQQTVAFRFLAGIVLKEMGTALFSTEQSVIMQKYSIGSKSWQKDGKKCTIRLIWAGALLRIAVIPIQKITATQGTVYITVASNS